MEEKLINKSSLLRENDSRMVFKSNIYVMIFLPIFTEFEFTEHIH